MTILHNVKREADLSWKGISESYLQFLKSMGSQFLQITVVFGRYGSSAKDNDHLRRTKNARCDIPFRPDIKASFQEKSSSTRRATSPGSFCCLLRNSVEMGSVYGNATVMQTLL